MAQNSLNEWQAKLKSELAFNMTLFQALSYIFGDKSDEPFKNKFGQNSNNHFIK